MPESQPLNIDYSDPTIGGQGIESFTSQQATSPALPAGTQTPMVPIEDQGGEQLTTQPLENLQPTAAQTFQADTAEVSQTAIDDVANVQASTYTAEQGVAEQGTVTEESTVQGQLKNLMQDVEEGTAAWANGAIRHATNLMAQRGIGASTMAGAAISTAIMEAAVPIAQLDAATYGQMNIENLRNRQSAMLSNTAATNAAKQFNSKSQQEIDQFMASFRDRMIRFNVEQKNSMEQFNTGQANTSSQFYDKMNNETDKFIAQNKMVIAKSNAEWRRTTNLANTAADNARLQQDTQNRFNISMQAQADMWQRARDVFHWANQSSENAKERSAKIAYYSLQQSTFMENREHDENQGMYNAIGGLVMDITSQAATSYFNS
jgi:hypothetical protein